MSRLGARIANGRDEDFIQLLFGVSPEAHGHDHILGSDMVAGNMIALVTEMGADTVDIGKSILGKHRHRSRRGAWVLYGCVTNTEVMLLAK